jgi:hypothetical protein
MSIVTQNGFPPLIKALNYLEVEQQKNLANPTVANGTLSLDYNGDGKFDKLDESFVRRQADLTPPGPAQDKFINQLYMVRSILDGGNQFELKSDQEQEQIAITLFDYNGDKALNKEDLLFKQAEVQQTGSAKAKAEAELLKAMGFDETPAVIAANEHAAYFGDPHVADPDRADKANRRTSNFVVLGDGIYNLLTDKNITLNVMHKKYDKWKIEVTDQIGLRIPNADLTMSAYGVPQLNGKDLKKGSTTTLPDQTKITLGRGGTTLKVTSGDSGEYNVSFYIVTTQHKNTDGKPIKYINTDVYTKTQGIASDGVMATGILGEGFDADSNVRTALKQALATYKRQSLLGEAPATTTVAKPAGTAAPATIAKSAPKPVVVKKPAPARKPVVVKKPAPAPKSVFVKKPAPARKPVFVKKPA